MKKLSLRWTLCLVFSCWCTWGLLAQCIGNFIRFDEQHEVDGFSVLYSDCTEILGDVVIVTGYGPDSIRHLDGLLNVVKIGGELTIKSASNERVNIDLSGLRNLQEIGGSLVIFNYDSLDFTSLAALEHLGNGLLLRNSTAEDFSGWEQLKSMGGRLSLGNVRMKSFAGLDSLRSIGGGLWLSSCFIEGTLCIPNLRSIGGDIALSNTCFESFVGMENLVDVSGSISIYNSEPPTAAEPLCQSGSLRGLSGIDTLRALVLRNTGIKDLGQLSSLKCLTRGIQFINNPYLEDISGLLSLEAIGWHLYITKASKLTSLRGLDNLRTIDSSYMVLIEDNDALVDIEALRNVDLFGTAGVSITENAQLNVCDNLNLCAYFANGGEGNIRENGTRGGGCYDTDELLLSCTDNLGKVQFHIFYDRNQNQVQDPDEGFFSDGSILVEPDSVVYFPQSNAPGRILLPPGSYTVRYNATAQPEWNLTTDSSSFEIQIDDSSSSFCADLSFGVFPNVERNEVQTNLGGLFPRCNVPNLLQPHVKNLGTTIVDGTLWLEVDENLENVFFASSVDTFVAPNRYGWFFSDLFPGYDFGGQLTAQIPGPPDFLPGDSLYFRTYADFSDGASSQQSVVRDHDVEIRCSYDPNDKLVDPAREGDWTLFEETLVYTIRFQNTGNDVAFDVQIRDTLATDLDLRTFRVLGSSHPLQLRTSLTDERYLVFDFPDIFLPDSASNPLGSQGYVTFQIDAVDGLPESTLIQNRAGIYFDANPPIITNYTNNVMVSELPVEVGLAPVPGVSQLQIVPNPTMGEVFLSGGEWQRGDLSIYDALGRRVRNELYQRGEVLDLSDLNGGVYWLTLRAGTRWWSGKVLVQR
ncbi:MAG: T9SS type A sorting domain-containing protein [Bacteroidota bacterium]